WFPAYVVNYILGGGGFSSRLMEQVREKRGLAYSVYSYLVPFKHGAILSGGVATENSRMKDSLDIIRAQWKRMAEEGPSEEELKNAKTYLTGSYPLQLDSTSSIASILVAIQIDNLGIDYLDRRNKLVDAVTLDDARRVAKRLLDPAKLTVVVVGDPQGLEPTAPEASKGAEGKPPENKTVEGRAPTLSPPLGQ
ncbi:MAG: insulinase family protein, partial [Rhodospirillales bacterium]|nr:insulinase family protein [Rhodospirillales bacterium]